MDFFIQNIEFLILKIPYFFLNKNIHRVSNKRKWILNIRNLFLVLKINGILFY